MQFNRNIHKVLVTGGAGYIGSHTVSKLLEAGYKIVVYDNLSTGFKEAVPSNVELVVGDIRDQDNLLNVMRDHNIGAVIHFAAKLIVEESVSNPYLYYNNNVGGSLALLEACRLSNINHFVFSSTAAVYGNNSNGNLINEETPLKPLNPYGETKKIVEQMLHDLNVAYGVNYVALRYFNVAGAATDMSNGQRTLKATHLIKVASEVAVGKRSHLNIYGTSYNTPDGTCIRDYIHVEDLADIHVLALEYLIAGGTPQIFNCGYGTGHSVLEVAKMMQKISNLDFPLIESGPRAGDAAVLVADSSKLKATLGWKPQRSSLELICRSAMLWEAKYSGVLRDFTPKDQSQKNI